MKGNANINANVDINYLLTQVQTIGQRTSYSDKQIDGGRFITMQYNGCVYAMYYHPTKQHSATVKIVCKMCKCYKPIRQIESTAEPGQWAIAYTKSEIFGTDEAYCKSW